MNVNGCAICGLLERNHGVVADSSGLHRYVAPTDAIRKARLSDPSGKV